MRDIIKIIPNAMTLIRIILSCILNLYICKQYVSVKIVILFTLLIFVTDFIDGKIARRFECMSCFGAVFDVIADLFYMVLSYIVLCNFNMLPLWFLFIIIFKFIEFVSTSFLINKYSHIKSIFIFDFIGRFVVTIIYGIPILTYVSFNFSKEVYLFVVNILLYIITGMSLISSIYRTFKCIEVFKNRIKSISVDKAYQKK